MGWVVVADGGVGRILAVPGAGAVQAIGNRSWSCGFAPAVGAGTSLCGALGVLALRLVRRRRSGGASRS